MSGLTNMESILIVDDEPQVLAALQDSLENDFHIITAGSAEEAINLISKNGQNLSVILSDQRMPGMAGHEFLAKARDISDASRLLITGFSDLEAVIAAVNEGKIFGYISKPWDTASLKLVIYKAAEHHSLVQQLKEREERFRQLAENIHDVFWMMSLDGKDIYISPAYEDIWGRSVEDLLKKPETWVDAIHPSDRFRAVLDLNKGNKLTDVFDQEYRIVRPDGTIRWIHDQAFPVLNQAGQIYRYAGIARDITERKLSERKISRLNRVYALLSGINSAIVRIRDRNTLFKEACSLAVNEGGFLMAWIGLHDPATAKVTIITQDGEFAGYTVTGAFSTKDDQPDNCALTADALRCGKAVICNNIETDPRMGPWKNKALKRGFQSIVVLPITVDENPIGVMALYAGEPGFFTSEEMKLLNELAGDVSYALQNIVQQEKLNYLAYYDSLTGLPNRSLFYEHLSFCLTSSSQRNKRIAVLVFDIKQFRHINNAYSKHTGDELLKEVASRLQSVVEDAANIGRITGDYFAVIIPDLDDETEAANLFNEKIISAMLNPVVINNNEIHIDITGGIAVYPADGNDPDTLYSHAEAALKKAKTSGSRFLFYQPEMTSHVSDILILNNKLRRALDENQFVLHYQPKVDSTDHKIIGLEALIRWQDPETGLVPPGKFIPILEETGMIMEVGNWAIEQALTDIKKMVKLNLAPTRIAVNVSTLQLQQKNFTDIINAIIQKQNGKDPKLDIEVTESILIQNIEDNINKFATVRDMGINISIDDFGTGYSSLSYLAKLPVNALKIDRTFINNMDKQPESMSIVSAIISLAHSLNLSVIAEGVETEEQSKLLRLLKCDEMQGFLFSKPVPIENIVELLRSGKSLLPHT